MKIFFGKNYFIMNSLKRIFSSVILVITTPPEQYEDELNAEEKSKQIGESGCIVIHSVSVYNKKVVDPFFTTRRHKD